MKKELLKFTVALFTLLILITGFAPEETYAVSSKCIATGCSSSCSKASWYTKRNMV